MILQNEKWSFYLSFYFYKQKIGSKTKGKFSETANTIIRGTFSIEHLRWNKWHQRVIVVFFLSIFSFIYVHQVLMQKKCYFRIKELSCFKSEVKSSKYLFVIRLSKYYLKCNFVFLHLKGHIEYTNLMAELLTSI